MKKTEFAFFLLLRILDLTTTYLNLLKNPFSEYNPFVQVIIQRYGIPSFTVLNLLLSLLVLFVFYKMFHLKLTKPIFYIFLGLNAVVIFSNTISLLI